MSGPADDRFGATRRPAADRLPPTGGVMEPTEAYGASRQGYGPSGLGFRARLTAALVTAAVLPILGFGLVAIGIGAGAGGVDGTLVRLLLLAIAISIAFAVLVAAVLAASLGSPLRTIAQAVERVSSGDLTTRIELPGDDEFSRLADSHNRLAADLQRRNRELRQILAALEETVLHERPEAIAERAGARATAAFGMIDCYVLLVDPREIPVREIVPGEARGVRAVLSVAGDVTGLLVGSVPATRSWERADQDLFELYAIEVAAAIRNAELYARVEAQNAQLVELDAAKDDFLRGVSHNLQTPLASIRGYAQQLVAERPDRRLAIITEQSDRLSRMVRQLLTVSRIESGALRPRPEVLAIGPRVRRTWEALGAGDVPFSIEDRTEGWLAVADADQLDQVLWALLDNAVGYGGSSPVAVTLDVDPADSLFRVTVTDHGPGVSEADRARLFLRYERGADRPTGEGSGLGLYVSRELCRAMGGDLVLEPARPGAGASFSVRLPAERAEET